MDQDSARQKVMRYYHKEDSEEDDSAKQDWNESKSLLDNILADYPGLDLHQPPNF